MLCRVIIFLFVCCAATAVCATTFDVTPRPAILLGDGGFVAQDSSTSVARYDQAGIKVINLKSGTITAAAVTTDESHLLIACDDGQVDVFELRTGKRLWSKPGSQTGLGYIYDASFAADGRSLIVGGHFGQAMVFDTGTGSLRSTLSFPPKQSSVMSAALSPDGTSGVLIGLGGELFTFETATGVMQKMGITGAWPVRYSTDGKFIAFRSDNSGWSEQVRVIELSNPNVFKDVGQFSQIGHIRPTSDGGFLVTAQRKGPNTRASTMGMFLDPVSVQLKGLWEIADDSRDYLRLEFASASMRGVATNYRLTTTVWDLKSVSIVGKVDNSANYQPSIVSWTSRGPGNSNVGSSKLWFIGGSALACMTLAIIALLVSRRRWRALQAKRAGFPIRIRESAADASDV